MNQISPRVSSESTGGEEDPFLSIKNGEKAEFLEFVTKKPVGYMLIIVSCLLLSGSFFLNNATSNYPSDAQCTEQMSTWSPMLEAVEYEWRHFSPPSPNPYYGQPSEPLEDKWNKLWQVGSVGISPSDMHRLNQTLEKNWTFIPEELGGGISAFFEVFHQLHCLNAIRQYSYRDQYNYSAEPLFAKRPKQILRHLEHCIEGLRQSVICTADTTPYLLEYRNETHYSVRTDALYRCRKFEPLLEWADRNVVLPFNQTDELRRAKDEAQHGHDPRN